VKLGDYILKQKSDFLLSALSRFRPTGFELTQSVSSKFVYTTTGGSNYAWLQLYLSVPCEAVCERKSKLQAVTAFTPPTAIEKRSKICMVKLWLPVRLDEGFE
jgi:hypothetical protein